MKLPRWSDPEVARSVGQYRPSGGVKVGTSVHEFNTP